VSEEGDTSEIDVASLSTLTHVATYIRRKMIALGGFLLLSGSAYIKTLAMWARAVYPFDFPPTTVDRWTFLIHFVWLGYRSTEQHRGVQEPPVDSSWEFPALRSTFLRVLSHVSEEGDTSKIDVTSLSTLTHVATYIRGK
jgi:hypothetical protein